eukprot:gene18662-13439_t
MVREARERMDITSMSRKSPEKILVMERKRQEAQKMLAALQREAAAQEAAKQGNRRTVVDGIREAANNLSQVINYHSYTNIPASLSRGNSSTQMNATESGGDAAPPMLGAMGRQMSSPLQSQVPPKLSKQQSWQGSSSNNLNASNASGGTTAGNANVAMSSKAQAAMQETKQKLGQFQLFRNKQNSSSNLNANPTTSPMTSNSSP